MSLPVILAIVLTAAIIIWAAVYFVVRRRREAALTKSFQADPIDAEIGREALRRVFGILADEDPTPAGRPAAPIAAAAPIGAAIMADKEPAPTALGPAAPVAPLAAAAIPPAQASPRPIADGAITAAAITAAAASTPPPAPIIPAAAAAPLIPATPPPPPTPVDGRPGPGPGVCPAGSDSLPRTTTTTPPPLAESCRWQRRLQGSWPARIRKRRRRSSPWPRRPDEVGASPGISGRASFATAWARSWSPVELWWWPLPCSGPSCRS